MNHGANAQTEPAPALPKQVQEVFDGYLKIQTALAQDSMEGVDASAMAITVTAQAVNTNMLPSDVAQQAKMLAKAGDLQAARDAFKLLSDSLINYLDVKKIHTRYIKVFCSMANARWLQTGSVVNNPYLGKDMARCGKIEG